MSEIKLLPCPFYGGEAELVYAPSNEFAGIPCYAVACKRCKVMVGTVQEGRTDFYRTQQEAIEIWNTRKPIEQIVEQLESIKDSNDSLANIVWNNAVKMCIDTVREGGAE